MSLDLLCVYGLPTPGNTILDPMTLASYTRKHGGFEAFGRRGKASKEQGNTESNATVITSLLPRMYMVQSPCYPTRRTPWVNPLGAFLKVTHITHHHHISMSFHVHIYHHHLSLCINMTIHHHLPGKKPEATLPGMPESPVQQLAVDLVTWQFRFVVQT